MINIMRRLGFKQKNEHHEGNLRVNVDTGHSAASSVSSTMNENISTEMQDVYETINILAGVFQTLNGDVEHLSSESLRLQNAIESLTQDFSTLKLSVEEQNAFLDVTRPNQEILQQDVASLSQKIGDTQYVSFDGTLTWKIVNFNEKMSKFNLNKALFY